MSWHKRGTFWVALLLALGLRALPAAAQADASSQFEFVSGNTNVSNCYLVASGQHRVTGLSMGNTGAAAWLKFYDFNGTPVAGAQQGVFQTQTAPGTQTVGTPVLMPIPGATALAGSNVFEPFPILFTQGIAMCATGGAANSDTTALTASQVAGTIFYQ